MALNTTIKKVAGKLIAKFGRDVTHIAVTDGAYTPENGVTKTEVSATISGFISSYKSRDYNDMILIGDAPMLTVSEVKIDDKIVIDTKEYRVTLVESTPLEDGIVVYNCNLRALS